MINLLFTFLLILVLPGFLLSLALTRRGKIDFLLLFLYSVIYGLAFQLLVTAAAAPSGNLTSVSSSFLALVIVLTGAYRADWWKEQLGRIRFTFYDVSSLLIAAIFVVFLISNVLQLQEPYFNQSDDQYFWLASAKTFTQQPAKFLSHFLSFNRAALHKHGFLVVVAPYTLFTPETLAAYQQFIFVGSIIFYALLAIAVAQLARSLLPIPSLGLLAPLIFFVFHWGNYYNIFADIVPQNLALPLFIIGFLFLHDYPSWKAEAGKRRLFIGLFLFLLYFIHLATLIIFLVVAGTAEIIRWLGRSQLKSFNLLTAPAIIVSGIAIVRIVLYLGGFLPNRPESDYYSEYLKSWNWWSQPYTNNLHSLIIWLALAGAVLAVLYIVFSRKKSPALWPLAISLAVSSFFLFFPIVPYHAIFASWQPFRYFLFIYPALAVFSLFPPALAAAAIKHFLSKTLAKAAAALMLILIAPPLLAEITRQQSFVFLDMIEIRTEEAHKAALEKKRKLKDSFKLNQVQP